MEITGEQPIAAPRSRVWEALNDPDILRQCIPGCQSLDKQGEDRFAAVAEVKIGPIGARFKGDVQLSELDPPNGYVIGGSGSGGIAGNAKGRAHVRLSDHTDGGTLVAYKVDAEVGGRMAQLGGPIIDATAKNLAGKFFAKFGELVGEPAQVPVHAGAVQGAQPAPESTPLAAPSATPSFAPAAVPARTAVAAGTAGSPLWGWIAALIVAIVSGFLLGNSRVPGSIVLVVVVLVLVVAAASFEAGRRGTAS